MWYNKNMKKLQDDFKIMGRVKWQCFRAGTKELLRESEWKNNLIMFGTNTGRDLILKRLAGDNTYTLNILYADIGTSSTAPTVGDTQLGVAVARAGSPVISQISNTVSFQFFWADASLANGSYYEIGAFVDGSATINTGKIFNHALFASVYTKATNEDTTIQIEFTIT